jgi:hypothetical protein
LILELQLFLFFAAPLALPAAVPVVRSDFPASPTTGRTACGVVLRSATSSVRFPPLREDLLMLRQDQGLQCLGIELIEIRKGGGIHCREPSTSLLQLD